MNNRREEARKNGLLVLGVDTCGPEGSVALTSIEETRERILAEKVLPGRTYSSTLVAKIDEILKESSFKLQDLNAIVVVAGPGSFTGVRVGLSAVKGLVEPLRIPVVAVSRLSVLAERSTVPAAALDAHRNEVFFYLESAADGQREFLAGIDDLKAIRSAPEKVVVCDGSAAQVVRFAWPEVDLVEAEPPTASDAILVSRSRILAGAFSDPSSLDGHYLRRSDAEILGDQPQSGRADQSRVHIRPMRESDLDQVLKMESEADNAPRWARRAYESALDPAGVPRRIALVAEECGSGSLAGFLVASSTPPEAELESIVAAPAHQRRGIGRRLFTAFREELKRHGADKVNLELRSGNYKAYMFYRSIGFTERGRRTGYYLNPSEDAILLSLELS